MSDTVIIEADGQPRSNWRDAVLRFGSRASSQTHRSTTTDASGAGESRIVEGHVHALDGAPDVH